MCLQSIKLNIKALKASHGHPRNQKKVNNEYHSLIKTR